MLRLICSIQLVSLLFFFSRAYGSGPEPEIESFSWLVSQEPSVLEQKFDSGAVARFINEARKEEIGELSAEDICHFRWVDVDSNGMFEFFVTIAGGRHFCNQLWIFRSVGHGKEFLQDEWVWMLEKLDSAIKDVNGDGQKELVLPVLLGSYRGARPMPVWTAVYEWVGNKFVQNDTHFPDFYREMLPSVENKIKEAEKRWPPKGVEALSAEEVERSRRINEQLPSVHIIIRDKILRLLGSNPRAGFEKAAEWMLSDDPEMRENAIIVLVDIFDQESKKNLESLAQHPDPRTSEIARRALENRYYWKAEE